MKPAKILCLLCTTYLFSASSIAFADSPKHGDDDYRKELREKHRERMEEQREYREEMEEKRRERMEEEHEHREEMTEKHREEMEEERERKKGKWKKHKRHED